MEVVIWRRCGPASRGALLRPVLRLPHDGPADPPSAAVRLRCPSEALGELLHSLRSLACRWRKDSLGCGEEAGTASASDLELPSTASSANTGACQESVPSKGGRSASDPLRVWVGLSVGGEGVGEAWWRRLERLLHLRHELERWMWWLSTLGGAYSALGDYQPKAIGEALRTSVVQLGLARQLGDEVLQARCRLYVALALIQARHFRAAERVIRAEMRLARSLKGRSDQAAVLAKSAQGVFAKLRWHRAHESHLPALPLDQLQAYMRRSQG